MKMSKFEITRTDINKVVSHPHEFRDEQDALGQYIACLVLARVKGIGDGTVDALGDGKYRLLNGWTLQVRPAR